MGKYINMLYILEDTVIMWWLIWYSAPDLVPGSNPASPTMILGRCRIIV